MVAMRTDELRAALPRRPGGSLRSERGRAVTLARSSAWRPWKGPWCSEPMNCACRDTGSPRLGLDSTACSNMAAINRRRDRWRSSKACCRRIATGWGRGVRARGRRGGCGADMAGRKSDVAQSVIDGCRYARCVAGLPRGQNGQEDDKRGQMRRDPDTGTGRGRVRGGGASAAGRHGAAQRTQCHGRRAPVRPIELAVLRRAGAGAGQQLTNAANSPAAPRWSISNFGDGLIDSHMHFDPNRPVVLDRGALVQRHQWKRPSAACAWQLSEGET